MFLKQTIMNVQYISDGTGQTTGVFIPIDDWEELKKKYEEIEQNESSLFDIPEWQKAIIRQRLIDYKEDPGNVLDWDDVKDTFNLD